MAGLMLLVAFILVSCERPDPEEAVVELPTQTPPAPPTAVPLPTQPPVQVYVVIAQPTVNPDQPVAQGQQVLVVTATPIIVAETAAEAPALTPEAIPAATALPDNYFLGWAWSDSLVESNNLVTVDLGGIILRDRPSQEGRSVGIVMGFADVIVVGKGRCGYQPIIVHAANMLSRTTPQLEVFEPQPEPTALPPFFPTPMPQGDSSSGWAFTDELTILGQTAISGPLGVNLRSDPCWGATNLGFIPAGSDLIVLGLPTDDYTPVRVKNDVLQMPFDPLIIATVKAEIAVNRFSPGSDVEVQQTEVAPTPTPGIIETATPSPTPSGSTTS